MNVNERISVERGAFGSQIDEEFYSSTGLRPVELLKRDELRLYFYKAFVLEAHGAVRFEDIYRRADRAAALYCNGGQIR